MESDRSISWNDALHYSDRYAAILREINHLHKGTTGFGNVIFILQTLLVSGSSLYGIDEYGNHSSLNFWVVVTLRECMWHILIFITKKLDEDSEASSHPRDKNGFVLSPMRIDIHDNIIPCYQDVIENNEPVKFVS